MHKIVHDIIFHEMAGILPVRRRCRRLFPTSNQVEWYQYYYIATGYIHIHIHPVAVVLGRFGALFAG